jgi:hypothetical protein
MRASRATGWCSHDVTGGERRRVKGTPALALLAICALINYFDRGNLSIAAPLLKDELRGGRQHLDRCNGNFRGSALARRAAIADEWSAIRKFYGGCRKSGNIQPRKTEPMIVGVANGGELRLFL